MGMNEVMVVLSVSLLALTLLYRNAGAFPYGTLGDLTHAIIRTFTFPTLVSTATHKYPDFPGIGPKNVLFFSRTELLLAT